MTKSMAPIRMYFAFRSPYSRYGLHRIAEAGVTPELIPFTGPPEGEPFRDPVASKAYLAYVQEDVLRMAIKLGLPIAVPDPFDIDFTPANKAFVAAARAGAGLAFALAASNARWGKGENISDLAVLTKTAEEAGLDGNLVENAQTDPSIDEELKRHRTLIEEDQVFGVPFFVANGQKYWGQDRIDMMLEDVNA